VNCIQVPSAASRTETGNFPQARPWKRGSPNDPAGIKGEMGLLRPGGLASVRFVTWCFGLGIVAGRRFSLASLDLLRYIPSQ